MPLFSKQIQETRQLALCEESNKNTQSPFYEISARRVTSRSSRDNYEICTK